MLITKNNGFEFVDYLDVKETEIYDYHRLAGSYALIKCNDKYLLCYNKWRKQWEIPAGKREKNESPKDCAIRELYEETGQNISELVFSGLLKVKNIISGEIKYNPVYFATIEELKPFHENNETSEILLWDLKQQIGLNEGVDR
ncbi:NUDIX domain-containing protein [Ornithinibacillus scapharcae]|uniref:NUDIX domain-containing protein n=1 Tax=Ornithinibacillus scapharcae TaxID=1147159 RepID=UPI000225AE2C|nr:NUDIX hydrolase [Ornithinibacillus scapharcae]